MAASLASAVVGTVVSGLIAGDAGDSSAARSSESDAASAASTRQQTKIAGEQYDFWKANFKPLEEALTKEAKDYGSLEEQEREAGHASAAAALAVGKARGAFDRNMASYGINPNSGRAADANLKLNLEGAKMDAAGQNLARKGVRDTAFSKKFDVTALGKGLPASASAGFGAAAIQSGNMGANQYARSQYEQEQARRGAAPFVSLAQKGVSRWFNQPGADTRDEFLGRAGDTFSDTFTNIDNPAYG